MIYGATSRNIVILMFLGMATECPFEVIKIDMRCEATDQKGIVFINGCVACEQTVSVANCFGLIDDMVVDIRRASIGVANSTRKMPKVLCNAAPRDK